MCVMCGVERNITIKCYTLTPEYREPYYYYYCRDSDGVAVAVEKCIIE